jgi:heptosyltransferase-3
MANKFRSVASRAPAAASAIVVKPLDTPKRILLIKLRHHGDVLLMTPTISALKQRYPQAEVDVLLYRETMPILSRNSEVANIWGLDRGLHGWQKLRHLFGLFRRLSARRYDWVIHLSDQWNGALLARLLHHGEAVGFAYEKRKPSRHWSKCFTRMAEVAPSDSLHAVEQNLLALRPLGIEANQQDKCCTMAISQQDRDQVRSQLAQLGVHGAYIVVHPAARWFFKCWEDERFAAVVQALANDGWPVILTGSPSPQEMQLVSSVMSQIRSPRVYSLAGQLSLNTLAALIEQARLFIGVDSAPMHMAAALKTDSIALFGPSKIHEWHPWMTRYCLINAADYGPLPDPDEIDTHTGQRYLEAIPTEAVLSAIQLLLLPDEAGRRG